MKLLSCALAALVVSGCGLCPTKIIEVPVEVQVPVPVRCQVQLPARPQTIKENPPAGGLYNKAVAIIQEGDAFRLYAGELEAALSKCADQK